MMATVYANLIQNKSAPNTVWKNTTIIARNVQVELYEDTDVLNPSLKLVWDDTYPITVNYLYINKFDRFYFIKKMTALTGGGVRIDCAVDPLFTYAAALSSCKLFITREGKVGHPTYIKDSQYPLLTDKEPIAYKLGSTFFNLNSATNTSRNFVLNIMGRKPS